MNFIETLETNLNKNRNPEYAILMENYMKNNFSFFGIKNEPRKAILKPIWKQYQTEIKANFREICWELFNKNEREFQYCAMEIIKKEFNKKFIKDDIFLIGKLITTNSWWDSVDFISKHLLGFYLIQFPNEKYKIIEKFSNSNNMWLNRSAIIFQLSYKANTNFEILISECEKHKESNEFFIQKAIGWALREYGSYNPNGVLEYVNSTNLKPLSKREAIRKLI